MQPDIHYDGKITTEFILDLIQKLKTALGAINRHDYSFMQENDFRKIDWLICRSKWQEILQYAETRCAAILLKIENEYQSSEYDHKCVDITLCILRDFDFAKSQDFCKKF